jgi:glycerol kinase
MSRYILALDQGTTSSRSMLFDRAGTVIAQAQQEFQQHFPQPGWVEHDAEEIWSTQRWTIEEVLRRAGAVSGDIAAVGITNQRETTVLWDRRTGVPLARAIVWQDRRTADRCAQLRALGVEADISAATGLLLDPYFSATKLAWLLDHIPDARRRAEAGDLCFGTIDSWLAWKLTSGAQHITDVSNASRTLLMNLQTGDWDERMLEIFRVPRACLPRIVRSTVPDGVRASTGHFNAPLGALAGDQQAALFGQACFQAGMAKNTYGTGCFLLLHTGAAAVHSAHRLLTTVAASRNALEYALEGSVFMGGATVQWLRDGLQIIDRAESVEDLAASVPDSDGVYLVPAFTGLGSPYWDPHARGLLIGITRGTQRGHVARAALEAIAFQSAELLQCMQKDSGQALSELRVDGGASRNDLLMQFQADVLGVPVVRPRVTETTALGAAYLAGIAVGFWSSPSEVAANWQPERRFEPGRSADWAQRQMAQWRRAVERARDWAREPDAGAQ